MDSLRLGYPLLVKELESINRSIKKTIEDDVITLTAYKIIFIQDFLKVQVIPYADDAMGCIFIECSCSYSNSTDNITFNRDITYKLITCKEYNKDGLAIYGVTFDQEDLFIAYPDLASSYLSLAHEQVNIIQHTLQEHLELLKAGK